MNTKWQFLDTSAMTPPVCNWIWGEETDAMQAAIEHHRILFENEEVRVLEVVIPPQEKEAFHTHKWRSIFIVDSQSDMRYWGPESTVLFERKVDPLQQCQTTMTWKEPEGLHAIENISHSHTIHGIRIEYKTKF